MDNLDSMTEQTVLALNSGSSSLKFGLYRVAVSSITPLLTGDAESIGAAHSRFTARDAEGQLRADHSVLIADQRDAMNYVVRAIANSQAPAPNAIGHRIVHGGPALRSDGVITPTVLAALDSAKVFAPLHTPAALSVVAVAHAQFPSVPHVACFDTSFHRNMPQRARVLPIPRAFALEGIERYGFHGLSCESILRQLGEHAGRRMIIAHLGSGSSVTAVLDGQSVDTSMGLTPTGGVMMGTRSGDLDPGLLLYLLREKKYDADRLNVMLQRESGLLGISGLSSDMRLLRSAAPVNADAALAIDMYCFSVAKQIAAMIAALNGVDTLVFTGGIGENDAFTREAICKPLQWIGVDLDAATNNAGTETNRTISSAASRCVVRIVRSEETQQIARRAFEVSRDASARLTSSRIS